MTNEIVTDGGISRPNGGISRPDIPDQPALRKLSKSLVQHAVKVSVQEAKAQDVGLEQDTDNLESWNPEQVYQKAISWVGVEMQEHLLDGFLDTSNDQNSSIDTHKFLDYLMARGLKPLSDPRLKDFLDSIRSVGDGRYGDSKVKQHIPREEFKTLILNNALLLGAIKGEFVVEDFQELVQEIDKIFEECKAEDGGAVTTYIPSLAASPAEKWAAAICTIDGQTQGWGDVNELATIQSVSKPIFYGLCLDELGEGAVHRMVGKEPSGHGHDMIGLGRTNRPHNPVINTGAITLASIYKRHLPMSARFQSAMSSYRALTAGAQEAISFNNTVYLSERDNGHRNYAIAHYLKSKGCLDEKVNLTETLELYFQMCSIEASTQALAIMAAALANGGKNVFTGEQVLTERSVQNMLSIMFSCGMYDYSGEWAFEIGLPAKSGISGFIIKVIPDIMGIAMWSPKLDKYGNSVRGVRFAQQLVSRYSTNKKQNTLHPFNSRRHALEQREQNPILGPVPQLLTPSRNISTLSNHGNTYCNHGNTHSNHGNTHSNHRSRPASLPRFGDFTNTVSRHVLQCCRYLKR